MKTKVLVPSGVLGLGFSTKALQAGLVRQPDIIAIDGGSTDSGPFYLGTGTSKYSATVCRAEWAELMRARAELNIPLIIGSCGTCGTDGMVDWMYQLTTELAAEMGHTLKIARIYCERSEHEVFSANRAGHLRPLDPAPILEAGFNHIVSMAGVEPLQRALVAGADVVLAGRTTDTALVAALPLLRGAHPGASWHGAKIAECGAFCSSHPATGVILLEIDKTGFTVEPMADDAVCTPDSVFAHMLYENANPFVLREPGGHLDVTHADYRAIDDRRVRVEGARWIPDTTYSVKLEAARLVGYQTSLLAIIRESRYVKEVQIWTKKLVFVCQDKIAETMELDQTHYSLECRLIGIDSALGRWEQTSPADTGLVEVGVLVLITAESQELATEIACLINPYLLHLALTDAEDVPTFAFPYSPAHSERGAVYEFALNHTLDLDNPQDGFKMKLDGV